MTPFSFNGIKLSSIAAAVPIQRELNRDFSLVTDIDRTSLVKSTGIKERRKSPPGQTSSDLCAIAASTILDKKKIKKDEIGLLIFVSQSNDYYLPATAPILQDRLGLPKNTIAFDVGLGCSGYVYGLTIAASLMQSCGIKKALLLAGDISSSNCSPEDKSTYPLFGDAGTATLLEQSSGEGAWHGGLFSDGSGANAIMIPHGMGRNPPQMKSHRVEDISPGIRRTPLQLSIKGEEIFAFAIKEVPNSVQKLMNEKNLQLEQVDYFIMHQANMLMNETIRRKLQVPLDKTPYSLDQFGNTSSASIPLTMVTRLADQLQSPKNLLLSGFGVGLSWGNIFLEKQTIDCLQLIEVA